jgi:branched-chain amino acid transport system substrate-binding protein
VHRAAPIVAVVAASLGLATACGGGSSTPAPTTNPVSSTTTPDRGNVDGTLRIGALLPTSGELAALGAPMLAGVSMAVQEINDAGGVNGRAVQLVTADEGADPSTAAVAVDHLLRAQRVDAIVGPASSTVALGVLDKIVEDRGCDVLAGQHGDVAVGLPRRRLLRAHRPV